MNASRRTPHRALGLPLLLLLVACGAEPPPRAITAKLGDTDFRLELALTGDQIQTGMMHRTSLDANAGMLFVFRDDRTRSFWMKNCLIPLDLLFLDKSGRIVAIHTMPVPDPDTPDDELPGYPSHYPARYAIEINAGRAGELNLKPGAAIRLPFEDLQRRADM